MYFYCLVVHMSKNDTKKRIYDLEKNTAEKLQDLLGKMDEYEGNLTEYELP